MDIGFLSLPAAMAVPTPAKTNRQVAMNSMMSALMQSGCAASRLLPKAIFPVNAINLESY